MPDVRHPLLMRAILLISLALLAAPDLLACQCGNRPTPTEAMGSALSVFDGTVVRRIPVLARIKEGTIVVDRYEFVVHQVWLGPGEPRRALLQGFTNCDSSFTVGARYLVFTGENLWGVPPNSSICLPTQLIREGTPALAELGPAFPLSPVSPVGIETRFQTRSRHLRAAFLTGLMLTKEFATHPREASRSLLPYLVSSLLCITAVAAAVAYCLVRRRLRLLLFAAIPFVGLAGLIVVLQGYIFLRSRPLLWYLIDYYPGGV